MKAVEIDGLTKVYGQVRALDGLHLAVEAGTVFGFLGPNGAGKTTTIRILTGLARPSAGKARVAGQPVGGDGTRVAHLIGYLPEEPAFYAWMTPGEFLDYVGSIYGLPAAQRKARTRELLELAGLAEVSQRRIGGFSRGMRQRLGLAQALVNHPEVLFLDEPVSALDPAGRKDVLDLIESLGQQATVFMSSHILADVERVCATVGIINQGRLVTQARREELLERYASPVFEVEAANGAAHALKYWAEGLQNLRWVASASVDGSVARILVRDVETARRELLLDALQSNLPLNRFEMVRPSLEDVFLRLVEQGKEEAR